MSIAFDHSASGGTTAVTPLAINPGAAAGSTIIEFVCNDSASGVTWTFPASFTQLLNQLCASSDGGSVAVSYKTTASGSEGSINTTNSGSTLMIGGMAAFSGVDQTTPIDVTPPAAVVNTTMTANPLVMASNSMTTVTDGCMIIAVRLCDVSAGQSNPVTFSTTTGSTGAWTSLNETNNAFYNVSLGYASQSTAGAVVVSSTNGGSVSSAGVLFVFALRPAGAGGGGAGHLVDGNLVNGSLIGSLAA